MRPKLKLVTGTVFIDGDGSKTVREIVEPVEGVTAEMLAEIAIAGEKIVWWTEGPYVDDLPEDQQMAQLGEQRLPGME